MELTAFRHLTERIRANLAADPRVLGFVACGSMAEQGRLPDAYSDHDFFVITVDDAQEGFRQDLRWIPDHERLVLTIRETAHGLKAFYDNAHLLEFAVFSREELSQATVNDYRVLIDKADIADRMRAIQVPPTPETPLDPAREFAMTLALLLIGTARDARGEHLSAHAFVKSHALHHLLPLLAHVLDSDHKATLDNLDPFRRFEVVFPQVGAAIYAALLQPVPEAALNLLDVLETHALPALENPPTEAIAAFRAAIEGLMAE